MVKPGESVDIPVLKAYAIWDLYAEWLDKSDFTGMTPEDPSCSGRDTPRPNYKRRTDPGADRRGGFDLRIDGRQGRLTPLIGLPHWWRNTLELAYLGDTLRSQCGTGGLWKDLHMG